MSDLTALTQTPAPGEEVSLFRIDASSIGGSIHYFCQGATGGQPVIFSGVPYTPIDITFSDFEINAGGVLPTPRMRVGNSNSYIQELINTYGDLCGCELRRVRTFGRFLDGQPDADPNAYIGPDVFRVEQKTDENLVYVEWLLSASIDQEGKMLPGRVVMRDTCAKRYRHYDPANPDAAEDGFVYPAINPCPYTGSPCFDENNNAIIASGDVCNHMVSGCKVRFINSPMPFGGFPGAARVQA